MDCLVLVKAGCGRYSRQAIGDGTYLALGLGGVSPFKVPIAVAVYSSLIFVV